MTNNCREAAVKEFFDAAGHGYEQTHENVKLHYENFFEEADELVVELESLLYTLSNIKNKDPIVEYNRQDMIKEMADVQYTLSGLAVFFNVDLQEAFERVHQSNMSKLIDGKIVKNEYGKVMKPDTYIKPDMQGL